MQRYAQLSGDTVFVVIESEIDPDGTNGAWVACPDHIGPGWTTPDGGATFAAPAPQPVAKVISKVQYLKRFTQAERIAIREAAKTSAVVNDYVQLLDAASDVDLADPDTVAGVQQLEAAGLLAAGRAAEILG